jgi:hypothetical protein
MSCTRCADTGVVYQNDPISAQSGFDTGVCYCICPKGRWAAETDAALEREFAGEIVTIDFGNGDTLSVLASQIITCERENDDDADPVTPEEQAMLAQIQCRDCMDSGTWNDADTGMTFLCDCAAGQRLEAEENEQSC